MASTLPIAVDVEQMLALSNRGASLQRPFSIFSSSAGFSHSMRCVPWGRGCSDPVNEQQGTSEPSILPKVYTPQIFINLKSYMCSLKPFQHPVVAFSFRKIEMKPLRQINVPPHTRRQIIRCDLLVAKQQCLAVYLLGKDGSRSSDEYISFLLSDDAFDSDHLGRLQVYVSEGMGKP